MRAILAILLTSMPLLSDTPSASVTGTVTDSSGGVMVDAEVRTRSLDTGVVRSTTTNQAGTYLLLGLQAGRYEISASHPQFTTARLANVALRVSDEVRIDLALVPGEAHESIVVADAAPLAQTESSPASAVVNERAIQTPDRHTRSGH